MTLRILCACTKCGRIYESEAGYDLNYMYGTPRVCPECQKKESV